MTRHAEIIRVQASAGSGKTYKLSHRYIEILTELFQSPKTGTGNTAKGTCLVDADRESGPENVLAITFTNKAAAEMKERILYFLKRIAFRDSPETLANFDFLDKETATRILTVILRDFSDFQVKTIDSFMNNILKAFAVDAGLFPDFKLEFDSNDVFTLTIETIFDIRPDLLPVLKDMLEAVLNLDSGQHGFDPRRITEKLLAKLKQSEDRIDIQKLSRINPFDSTSALNKLKKLAIQLIDDMERQGKKIFNGRSFKPDNDRKKIDRYGKFPNWMTNNKSLLELKNKKAQVPDIKRLQGELDNFRRHYLNYLIETAVEEFRAPVQVFAEYSKLEKQLFKEVNRFEIGKMASVIQKLLEASGAPVAFCRLGEQYNHYLIDEFQDTSRNQWNAMLPLVANSLSKGGSLFLVGDTKQAIYGWRGGDYKLFHEIPEQNEIRLPADGNITTHSLETNYRSARQIVEFNNRIFSEKAIKIISDALDLSDLTQIYEKAGQMPRINAPDGSVSIKEFTESNKELRTEETQKWCKTVLKNAANRFGPGGVLILARSREKVRTIAGWLVDMEIPFVTEDSLKLFGNLTVKSLLALLAALVLPDPDTYILGLIETGFFGKITAKESVTLLREYGKKKNEDKTSPWDFLMKNAPEFYKNRLEPLNRIREKHAGYELASALVRFLGLEQAPDRNLIDRFLEEILTLEEDGITDTVDIVNQLYEKMDDTSLSMPETKNMVRIMTIHKAKGLESPVVLLPFLDWKLENSSSLIIGETEPGSGKYLRINKEIADLDPELGKIHREAKARETVEAINLLYVALTRAKRELYIGIPPDTKKQTRSTIQAIFRQLMAESGFRIENGEFSIGSPGKAQKPLQTPFSPPAGPPLRDAANLLSYADRMDESFELEGRLRGIRLHKAMSFILHVEDSQWQTLDTNAKDALARANAALGIQGKSEPDSRDILAITRILTALKPWFSPELSAWNEKEFVGEKGEMIRVDRLVKTENRFILIDYKTGQPDKRYRKQLTRYMEILRPLGGNIVGILAYFDTGEIDHVQA